MVAIANQLADLAKRCGVTVAVAESLTAGNVATALGAAPDSAVWFRGGVVAYATEVKRHVLEVPDVPVVSETAAIAMAEGVRSLMDADIAVTTTGVGGPEPQDGEAAGSVWSRAVTRGRVTGNTTAIRWRSSTNRCNTRSSYCCRWRKRFTRETVTSEATSGTRRGSGL